MMPMIMAMKMMNPPQKQDQATPLFMMMMMDSMKKSSGGGDLDKKIGQLEEKIKAKEDKKMYEEVMREIKEIQKSKDAVGIKDILALAQGKDKTIEEIKNMAAGKDREMLMKEFANLQATVKASGGSGIGELSKLSETLKAVKNVAVDLGIDKTGNKSKEEILKDLVESTASAFAPAVNDYVKMMTAQPQQAGMTEEQMKKLHEIQAQRQGSAPSPAPAAPQPERQPTNINDVPGEGQSGSYIDEHGDRVYPSLIKDQSIERPPRFKDK